MKYHVIILAGGTGERFGLMKQFVPLDGKPIFIRTLQKFIDDKNCKITLVIPEQFKDVVDNCLKHYNLFVNVVFGGCTRQESVKNALVFIEAQDMWGSVVLITDANRPLVKKATIHKCLVKLQDKEVLSVLTACKSINTSCIAKTDVLDTTLDKILDREKMFELLMPQGFTFHVLYDAHMKTKLKNATDDMQVILSVFPKARASLIQTSFWEGLKLTHPEDYKIFEVLCES
jgi:2-C-methyl-D-erythritol 4-phosphate cytidylyltransferase